MDRIVYVHPKKSIKDHPCSLDLALGYLKNNLQFSNLMLKPHRWLADNYSSNSIGRTSYQNIVIPEIERINSAISRYIPEFEAFKLVQTAWRKNKFHKSIQRNQAVRIQEDEENFYIEVTMPELSTEHEKKNTA